MEIEYITILFQVGIVALFFIGGCLFRRHAPEHFVYASKR